jgi:hypothetical protein
LYALVQSLCTEVASIAAVQREIRVDIATLLAK